MIDDVVTESTIKNIAEDGTVTLQSTLKGITLKVFGSTRLSFSTHETSLNKSAREKDYRKVFDYLIDTPFTATVNPSGQVTSIQGKINKKITKVKNAIPDAKVNGNDITFFTEKILSKKYLKNVLSVGWIQETAVQLKQGELIKKAVPTPPIPGNAHGTFANMRLQKKKETSSANDRELLMQFKAGLGRATDRGKAGLVFSRKPNIARKTVVQISYGKAPLTTRFNVKFKRQKK